MTQEWNSFLAAEGLAADGSRFGGSTEELIAARDGAVMAPLTDLGLIRASGVDSAVFLHNLLTNDISGIGPTVRVSPAFARPRDACWHCC
jgi:glycine cleavage system aminomethyltransferase T